MRPSRVSASRTCCSFAAICSSYARSWKRHPPQTPKCLHGASTRFGLGSRTDSATASANPRFVFVTRARTRSPGRPPRTNTTKPFSRATPLPPYASESMESSSSSPLRTGAAMAASVLSGHVLPGHAQAAEHPEHDDPRQTDRAARPRRERAHVAGPVERGQRSPGQVVGHALDVDETEEHADQRLDKQHPDDCADERDGLVLDECAHADAERAPENRGQKHSTPEAGDTAVH